MKENFLFKFFTTEKKILLYQDLNSKMFCGIDYYTVSKSTEKIWDYIRVTGRDMEQYPSSNEVQDFLDCHANGTINKGKNVVCQ